MEVVSNRPAIDYLVFLQMIINNLSSKENPSQSELATIEDAKKQINLILKSVDDEQTI